MQKADRPDNNQLDSAFITNPKLNPDSPKKITLVQANMDPALSRLRF